jgi:hypothetical protein
MTDSDSLIKKLNRFRRKYYTNMLIRGAILSTTLLIILVVATSLSEHFSYFAPSVRTGLFYGLIAAIALIFGLFIIRPILKIVRFGKTIDDRIAAKIIGRYFPDIKDKLLNVLQLKEMGMQFDGSHKLIEASIEQRTIELKPFAFQSAVSFKVNRKYLKYALPAVFILTFILLFSPDLITEPSKRIYNYQQVFERPAPFQIEILNVKMEVIKGDNFDLKIKVLGDEVPASLYLISGSNRFKLKKENLGSFYHNFSALNNDVKFQIINPDFQSKKFLIKVMPRPILNSFEVYLEYPTYTSKENEILENTGEFVIPEGTRVNWKFFTNDVDSIYFAIEDEENVLVKGNSNVFEVRRKIKENANYRFQVWNQFSHSEDTLSYAIAVVKDEFPEIEVKEEKDPSFDLRSFFTGFIKDDYGFDKLKFKYEILGRDFLKESDLTNVIDTKINQQQFFYSVDLDEIDMLPGEEIVYYFEIWDNDQENGSKSARSESFTYRLKTSDEIKKEIGEKAESVERDLEKKLLDLNMLNQEMDELTKQLMQKEKLDWKDVKNIENILKKQQALQEDVKNIAAQNKENINKQENSELEKNNELLEKQKQIQDLLEKVLDEETKELMRKLQEMLQKMDKDKVMDMMEKIKMSNEELEKNLDRNLEMLKQLEYERLFNELTDKLKELAEKQKELSKSTNEKNIKKDDAKKQQSEIKKEFDEIKEEIMDLEKKNQELESKNQELKTEDQEQEIDSDLDKSQENLEKGKMKKASESQESSSEGMKKMAEDMIEMFAQSQAGKQEEDMQLVREILENLIQQSFDQEELIITLGSMQKNDPSIVQVMQKQNDIRENMSIVEDSLRALSKRQIAIQPFVLGELEDIDLNLKKSLNDLKERRISLASKDQQYTMTSINNLALLLNEALQQMQSSMNMKNSMSGKGSCSKPGGKGQSSAKSLKQLQKQLNNKMGQMQKGMKGKSKEGKDGKSGENGQKGSSEQFARMAAEQAAIREKLGQYMESLEKNGVGSGGLNDALKEMEKTEEELVNKILNNESIERQKDILTRLLKSEKAEMKREKKMERESSEAKNVKRSNPEGFLEYKRKQGGETELLRQANPKLKSFYQKKVNAYFFNSALKSENE